MSSSESEGASDVRLCFVTSEAFCSGIAILFGFSVLHFVYFIFLTLPCLKSEVEMKAQILAIVGVAYGCSVMTVVSLCRL